MDCYCQRAGVGDVSYSDKQLPIGPEDHVCVIFGSRSYNTADGGIKEKANMVIDQFDQRDLEYPDVIVSGGAGGADAVAEAVALQLSVPMIVLAVNQPDDDTLFRRDLADAEWHVETVTTYQGDADDPRSGNGAYLTRNCVMAELVGRHDGSGFAIWDGESSGTAQMLDSCESHGVETAVWEFTA